jgi:hypothetical protein
MDYDEILRCKVCGREFDSKNEALEHGEWHKAVDEFEASVKPKFSRYDIVKTCDNDKPYYIVDHLVKFKDDDLSKPFYLYKLSYKEDYNFRFDEPEFTYAPESILELVADEKTQMTVDEALDKVVMEMLGISFEQYYNCHNF